MKQFSIFFVCSIVLLCAFTPVQSQNSTLWDTEEIEWEYLVDEIGLTTIGVRYEEEAFTFYPAEVEGVQYYPEIEVNFDDPPDGYQYFIYDIRVDSFESILDIVENHEIGLLDEEGKEINIYKFEPFGAEEDDPMPIFDVVFTIDEDAEVDKIWMMNDDMEKIVVYENRKSHWGFTFDDSSEDKEPSVNFPAFGPITIAESATKSAFPIGASDSFEYGITEVAAIFPYTNMNQELYYTAEWMIDGEELITEEYPWEDTTSGMHYTSLTDDDPLPAGHYRLNLYLEDELVRTASFEIVGHEEPEPEYPEDETIPEEEQRPSRPATPEEVVDPEALKYFYMIYDSWLPILHTVINDNLTGWTTVEVVDDNICGEGAVACFHAICDQPWGGTVYLIRSNMQNKADFEITEDLVHELTHGMEHYMGMRCGCSVEKEFYAFAAELDYLWYSGHSDYMENKYAGLWAADGSVDTGLLWDIIKEGYGGPNCPDY